MLSSQQPRRRQKRVLHLEAKRAAAAVVYTILAVIAGAVSVSAKLYPTSAWPPGWRLPNGISPRATMIAFIVAGVLALLLLFAAVVNGRRWHLAHVVERLSREPYLASSMPRDIQAEFLPRAYEIPQLEVSLLTPRKLPRPQRLRRVTRAGNVTGANPLSIAYLRLFENGPRTRTFIQGAWREFGYAHFLRSAASVTPGEFRHAKRAGSLARLFLTSLPQFTAQLAQAPAAPSRRHWRAFTDIAPRKIRVWDRYGSYLPSGYLCHGTIWKLAIDELLRNVDLVVLDLSGFMPQNLGTGYELQRVVDRFPVERVVFLADKSSDHKFLQRQILAAWQKMAAGSPNSGTEPRTAFIAITDNYRRRPPALVAVPGPRPGQVVIQQQGAGQVRLVTSRRKSRRLAAVVQERASHAALPPRVGAWQWPSTQAPPAPRPAGHQASKTAPAVPSNPWPGPHPSVSRPEAALGPRVGKVAALIGGAVFLASVTLFKNYTDSTSLFLATDGDLASPLHPHDFRILLGLLAAVLVFTLISLLMAGRWVIVCATVAALGLVGYTLYIPSIGTVSGFGLYGSSYWVSLAAAVVMTLGAGAAAFMPAAT